jgi:predicted Rossmann-fold nucleotide-binding protein
VSESQNPADEGTIDDEDLELIRFAETPEEAWDIIRQFHRP